MHGASTKKNKLILGCEDTAGPQKKGKSVPLRARGAQRVPGS